MNDYLHKIVRLEYIHNNLIREQVGYLVYISVFKITELNEQYILFRPNEYGDDLKIKIKDIKKIQYAE